MDGLDSLAEPSFGEINWGRFFGVVARAGKEPKNSDDSSNDRIGNRHRLSKLFIAKIGGIELFIAVQPNLAECIEKVNTKNDKLAFASRLIETRLIITNQYLLVVANSSKTYFLVVKLVEPL